MQRTSTKSIEFSWRLAISAKLRDYAQLTKMRLSFLVVFSAVIGYLLGFTGVAVSYTHLLILSLGGILVTGASNAINQIIERDIDKLMTRTASRPLPSSRMNHLEAAIAAGAMGISGIVLIAYFFNSTAGVLSAISLLSYAFVYTPLKRVSPIAVFVGAIPGALPTTIGYVCANGTFDYTAVLLFTIQFLWQFPHFWAIAWVQYEDYKKAGIMLLPSASGKTRNSAIQNVIYSFMLLLVSVVPYFVNIVGLVGTGVIFVTGLMFLWLAIQHVRYCDDASAKKLMFGSFIYLPVVQLAMVIDKVGYGL